jgi:hypothetical protein
MIIENISYPEENVANKTKTAKIKVFFFKDDIHMVFLISSFI